MAGFEYLKPKNVRQMISTKCHRVYVFTESQQGRVLQNQGNNLSHKFKEYENKPAFHSYVYHAMKLCHVFHVG